MPIHYLITTPNINSTPPLPRHYHYLTITSPLPHQYMYPTITSPLPLPHYYLTITSLIHVPHHDLLEPESYTLRLALASYPGLLTPVFVACNTNAGESLVKLSHVQ